MSPSAPPALSMLDTGQGSDCTSSQSQPLDRTSSAQSPLNLHHTSLPQESHTNNITPSMETTKSTQVGFLSLPPEIRNMIYHYIFAPVRDGTCCVVYADWGITRLQGFRRNCSLCRSAMIHRICRPEYASVTHMIQAFEFSGNSVLSGILQTCSTVLIEALPISLSCMQLSITYSADSIERLTSALQLLLAYIRQPKGAYLSVFRCTYYQPRSDIGDDIRHLSQLINGLSIRFDHLILCELASTGQPDIGKHFVLTVDSLHHKPAKVEWVPFIGTGTPSDRHYSQRMEFNEAAGKWLAKLAKVKASDPAARLPLLRDSLPHFFEESAG
jgi:hypothetical protein